MASYTIALTTTKDVQANTTDVNGTVKLFAQLLNDYVSGTASVGPVSGSITLPGPVVVTLVSK